MNPFSIIVFIMVWIDSYKLVCKDLNIRICLGNLKALEAKFVEFVKQIKLLI